LFYVSCGTRGTRAPAVMLKSKLLFLFLVLPMVAVITDHREWILCIGDNTSHRQNVFISPTF